MKESMPRTTWFKTATSEDRREYGKWAWRVSVLYGLLVVGGIGFAVVHQHQSSRSAVATGSPAGAVTLSARR